eukprot:403341607
MNLEITHLQQLSTLKEVGESNKVIVHCQENDGRISFSKASDGSILKYFQITASEFVAFCTSSGQLGMMTLKTKKIEMFQETGHLQNHPLISVSFNKDNEYLASASSDGIICVRSLTKPEIMQFQESSIKFSYVKHYILASAHENGKICIWDTQLRSKKWEVPQAHQTFVTGLAFSPVNNLLLTSCGLDGKIQFYDIQNQKTVKTIDNQNQLSALSFCYDGHTIAVGTTNGNIQVYDLKEKQKIKYELRGQEGQRINCLQFMRDPNPKPDKDKQNGPAIPSSLSYFQAPLNIRQSNDKIGTKAAFNEVQNTQQNSKSASKVPPSKQSMANSSKSKDGTPSGAGNIQKQATLQQIRPGSGLSSNVVDEKTIRYIEEQKIDATRYKIEEQLRQLQTTFDSSKIELGLGNGGQQKQTAGAQQTINLSDLAHQANNNHRNQSQPPRDNNWNRNTNAIREENEDDELLDELNMRGHRGRSKPNKPSVLSYDVRNYIDQVFQDQAQSLKMTIQNSISNLHVELIRSLTIQENELRESLGKLVDKNKMRKKELRYLRKENKKLKSITY